MANFLDKSGFTYFWSKLKTYLSSNYAAKSHTHNYAGSDSAGGSATSAKKLATARKINLGNAATGTATAFDGSGDITIPVTGLNESYLRFGDTHYAIGTGIYGPLDYAINPQLSANRLAGIKPEGVSVEYSIDGGNTWLDYGLSDSNKRALCTTNAVISIAPNTAVGSVTENNQVRITIDGVDGGVYAAIHKIHIYMNAVGSQNPTVTVEASEYGSPDTFTTIIASSPLMGSPAWNVLNFKRLGITGCFGGTNHKNHIRKLRFTFRHTGCISTNKGLLIYRIYAYGVGYTFPSQIAETGTPYYYDASGITTFTNNVKAPTRGVDSNDTNVATTAFVHSVVDAAGYHIKSDANGYYIEV